MKLLMRLFKTCIFLFVFYNAFSQHSLWKPSFPVNTSDLNEICPVVSYDESQLFFTRVGDPNCDKTLVFNNQNIYETLDSISYEQILMKVYSELAKETIQNPIQSPYNQDIWYTNLIDGKPDGIFHPGYPINDVLPNSICSNFGTKDAFVVINQFAPNGGIEKGFSITNKDGDFFSFPEPIHILSFSLHGAEVNVTSSLDSSVLIIAMETAETQGDMDLFVSYRLDGNTYSRPLNMGKEINTSFRESTPMLSHDKKTLYFTSDRPGGWGGKDIFVSKRKDFTYTSWTKAINLNPPVNSPFDDSHPHVMKDNNTLFFTSNRDGTSDIFRAKLVREKLKKEILITINIISEETNQLCAGELVWGDVYPKREEGFFRARDGKCRYQFYDNKPIYFKAKNRNYSSDEVIIDPQDLINQGDTSYVLNLFLKENHELKNIEDLMQVQAKVNDLNESELKEKSTIILKNIYFEKAKSIILPESFPSIQKLAKVLKERPSLKIQIIGHTDNVGDKTSLKELSENRAIAIKAMLIKEGVQKNRIDTNGCGDAFPLGPNDTEANKSKNRRVEIKVVTL
jgi:outer membrane protein OmpA-like peptidoglycan-associated protein